MVLYHPDIQHLMLQPIFIVTSTFIPKWSLRRLSPKCWVETVQIRNRLSMIKVQRTKKTQVLNLRTCDNCVPIVYPFYHGGIIKKVKKVNQVNLTRGIKIFCAKTKNESEIEKSSDFGRKFGRNPVEKRSFTRNFSTKLVRK